MRLLICILAINASIAISGTIDPNIPDYKYIEYGTKFKCVVKICGNYISNNKTSEFCGSAVAINSNWIITAAHVVNNASNLKITDNDGVTHNITKIIIHNDFQKNIYDTGDIALCYLEQSLKLDFYPELYKQKDELGKICGISGFGITGNFITGENIVDNKKRAGSNIIDKIYNEDLLICSPSAKNSKDRTSLEYLIAHGDSGGGLFIDKKLAGINSRIITTDGNTNADYGDESGHTRISKYIDWIEENIK